MLKPLTLRSLYDKLSFGIDEGVLFKGQVSNDNNP